MLEYDKHWQCTFGAKKMLYGNDLIRAGGRDPSDFVEDPAAAADAPDDVAAAAEPTAKRTNDSVEP
eukprot:13050806-Alexandrium_andersonii.AAC.1